MAADALANHKVPLLDLSQNVFTVATVPAAATYPYRVIVVSNGNAGALCLAMSDGTNWLVVAKGAAIAAS
jgi:UDP:flavonoid glycosyltransferase YjiC (YdhE family)